MTTDLHYVRAFLNLHLLGEACLHDDAKAKETLIKVLFQKTINTPTTYALTLKDYANFVENRGFFFNTARVKDLNLSHMSDGI